METVCFDAKKGVVVFLDALGVSNSDPNLEKSKEFISKRDLFIKCAKELWETRNVQFKKDLKMNLPEPEIATFQDSIIICWSEQEQKQDSLPILLAAGQWLTDAINFAIGIKLFFRGSISVGNYIFNTSAKNVTIIGQAVFDAHRYERIADWIGVIQTPDCQKEYLSFLKSVAKKENQTLNDVIEYYHFLFVPYHIPLRKEKNEVDAITKEEFYALSWPLIACKIEQKKSISQVLLDNSRSVNREYKSKYDNANKFFEWYKTNIFPKIPKQ